LKKLPAISEKDQEINLTSEDYDIIDKRRASHLNNETKSYSWEEVKSNARLAK
jgi:hypothetical protein